MQNREQRRKAEKDGTQTQIIATDLPDMGSARLFPYIDETHKAPIGHVLVFEPFIFKEYCDNSECEHHESKSKYNVIKTHNYCTKFKDIKECKAVKVIKEMVGIDRGQCIIWDTWVEPQYRQQGMGEYMLNSLKEVYDKMLSGARSAAGQTLAIKCGFQLTSDGRYYWEKEEDGASESNEDKKNKTDV